MTLFDRYFSVVKGEALPRIDFGSVSRFLVDLRVRRQNVIDEESNYLLSRQS